MVPEGNKNRFAVCSQTSERRAFPQNVEGFVVSLGTLYIPYTAHIACMYAKIGGTGVNRGMQAKEKA